jgi:hypothetical protein
MSSAPTPRPDGVPGAVPYLRWILFALLLGASAAALVGLPRSAVAGSPEWPRWVPVGLLVLFIGGYATYRFTLVRAGHYPAGKALVRIGAMLLLLGVIVGIALDRPVPPVTGPDLAAPLAGPDPVARALAAELVRYRPHEQGLRHVGRLVALLDDPSAEVRREAHASLVALAGADAGQGPGSAERWRALWASRGVTVR